MQARAPTRPPLCPPTTGAAPPLFTLEGISLDCKYFNSQKLKEGVGHGLGWCGSRLSLFFQAFSDPVSDNSVLRHAVVCQDHTHDTLDTDGNTGSGLVTEQGEAGRSQSPHSHWVEQGQVLRPLDGQLPGGVVVDDFWDTVERGAVLTQNILLFGLGQFHVHKALVAPAKETRMSEVCGV